MQKIPYHVDVTYSFDVDTQTYGFKLKFTGDKDALDFLNNLEYKDVLVLNLCVEHQNTSTNIYNIDKRFAWDKKSANETLDWILKTINEAFGYQWDNVDINFEDLKKIRVG